MKDALPAALPGLPLVGNVAEAVVKETLRLCPPAWTVYRVAEEDTEVGGHTIVAATEVWTSQWVVHRDGRFFERPDAFVPERCLAGLEKASPGTPTSPSAAARGSASATASPRSRRCSSSAPSRNASGRGRRRTT